MTWVDWERRRRAALEFTRELIRMRAEHPTFRRRRFFDGRPDAARQGRAAARHRLARPRTATEMAAEDWDSGFGQVRRRVPQRRRHPERGPRGEQHHRRRLPAALQRPRRARLEFAAAAAPGECRAGWRYRRRRRVRRAHPEPQRWGPAAAGAASWCYVAKPEPRGTYRLQPRADSASAPPRRSCPTSPGLGVSHLTCAHPAGRPRLDPRLRRGRSRPPRRRAGRREGLRRAVAAGRHTAWPCSSTACPTT